MADVRQEENKARCYALLREVLKPMTPYELGVQMAKESIDKYFEIKR